jgi:TonB-linked SusC/RagA family outer membrane protein
MKKGKFIIPDLPDRNWTKILRFCILVIAVLLAGTEFSNLNAQKPETRTISGVVRDNNGEALPGAAILVKGSTIGQNTDINGKFQISVPANAKTLVVSFVGMQTKEVEIGSETSIKITLTNQAIGLEEVLVVGYGVQKKVTVTGSVAAVKAEQLLESPVANVSNALAGRTSGLLVVQRTSEPGDDQSTLRIRGTATFSGNTDPLIMVDGIEAQSFNNIDPNEIENITILKDASATAVYGVRGANGVLLITTKRGKTGKPQMSYTSNFAMNRFVNLRERMRSYDYATGWENALKYDSYIRGTYTPVFTPAEIEHYKTGDDPIFYPDVDWVSMVLKQSSFQQQHNFNIRGGTESVKYFVSGGYFEQGGLFNNTNLIPDYLDIQTKFKRYNFRSNFDFDITKRLGVVVNVSTQIENKNGINADDASGMIRAISISNPMATPGIVDGKFVAMQSSKVGSSNPLLGMYQTGFARRYRNYLNGSVRMNYKLDFITDGLTAHGTISYQNFNMQTLAYSKAPVVYNIIRLADNSVIYEPTTSPGPVSMSESTGKNRMTYAEAGLDYTKRFGSHNVTGLLLYNQSKRFDPGLQFLIPNGYQGLVGRVAYDYKNRYLAEFNFGYNGTENFAPGKRFGFFPAYSLGWVLSDEPFFPKNSIIPFVKFRASYGEVGNDKIGGSRFLYRPSSYMYSSSYFFGTVGSSSQAWTAAYEGKIGNPGLTWERAKKANAGVEFTLFKDKIRFSGDWFSEKRDNILTTSNTVPDLLGAGNNMPALNIGRMKNSGIDFEVTYNDKVGNLNYWIKGNYTYAHNVVLFQDEVPNPYVYQYKTGQRNGQMFGYLSQGLFNSWEEVNDAYRPMTQWQNNRIQPGDIKMKDINGDGILDSFDGVPQQYSDFPEKIMGFSFGGNMKGLDFSVLFQAAANVTFNGQGQYIGGFNNFGGTAEYLNNSWTAEKYANGDNIVFPHLFQMSGVNLNNPNSGGFYMANASYIRLKNVEVGYTIKDAAFLRSAGIGSARLYVNGTNLAVWTPMSKMYPGVDPENTSSFRGDFNHEPYPATMTLNFGLNVNF